MPSYGVCIDELVAPAAMLEFIWVIFLFTQMCGNVRIKLENIWWKNDPCFCSPIAVIGSCFSTSPNNEVDLENLDVDRF